MKRALGGAFGGTKWWILKISWAAAGDAAVAASSVAANNRFMSFPLLVGRRSLPSVELGDEVAWGVNHALQFEVDAPDLAPVAGLHLHLPVARLPARLQAVAAEAGLAAADDLDRDGVLQRPAAPGLVPVPQHLHLVREPGGREDAEIDVHLVAGLGAEPLVAVVPDAPERTLVAQPVALLGALDAVVDAHERDRQRHRRDTA